MFTGCQNTFSKKAKQPINGSVLSQTAPGVSEFDRDLSIARLSERHDEVPKAKKIYLAILKRDPQNQEALHRMGVIAAQEGRTSEALNYIESALAQGNASAELLGDLGYIQFKQGRLGAAEDTLNRSLDRDPRNKRSINNLGLCLVAQKKYDRALSLFRQIGSAAEAYSNLAYAQSQQGDIAGAEHNYHLALEADPDTKVAAEALLELGKHQRFQRANQQRSRIAQHNPRRERGPRQVPDQVSAVASVQRYREPVVPAREPIQSTRERVVSQRERFPTQRQPAASLHQRVTQEPVAPPQSLASQPQNTTEPQIGFYPSRAVLSRNITRENSSDRTAAQAPSQLRAADAIVSMEETTDPFNSFIDSVADTAVDANPLPPVQRNRAQPYAETMRRRPTTSRAADAIVSVNEATDRFIDSVANVSTPEGRAPLPPAPDRIIEVAANEIEQTQTATTQDFSVLNVQVASFEPVDYVPTNAVSAASLTAPIEQHHHAPQATNSELFHSPPPLPAPLGTPSTVGEPKKQGAWWPDSLGVVLEPVEQPALSE